jgi:hypothetical protein
MSNITDPEDVSWLLNIANDMRKAKGDKLLVDLPSSVPQDPNNCIIANAFNYGCNVDPAPGIITFQNEEDVDTYFQVMGLNKADFTYDDDDFADDEVYRGHVYDSNEAPMTQELIDIAEAFDNRSLFLEYVDGYEIKVVI